MKRTKKQDREEAEKFEKDMERARALSVIIQNSFSVSEEDQCLKKLREIKLRWGHRYLP